MPGMVVLANHLSAQVSNWGKNVVYDTQAGHILIPGYYHPPAIYIDHSLS